MRRLGFAFSALILLVGIDQVFFGAQSLSSGGAPPTKSPIKLLGRKHRDLTRELLKRRAGGKDRDPKEIEELAASRRAALLEALNQDPESVLQSMLPKRIREKIDSAAYGAMEEEVSDLEGDIVTYAADEEEKEIVYHYLYTDDGKRYPVYLVRNNGEWPSTGSRVRIKKGFRIPKGKKSEGNAAIISDYSDVDLTIGPVSSDEVAPFLTGTMGPQATLVILMNFQNQPTNQPWTKDQINTLVFTTLSNHDYESSFHQTTMTGDVAGWFTAAVPSTTDCDTVTNTMSSAGRSAAAAAGFNLSNYKRFVYMFPKVSTCGWAGLGTVGSYGGYSESWINGTSALNVIGHELGHNFGLYHANAYNCGQTSSIGSNCTSIAYADPSDMMGNRSSGHFNAFQKERLGWLNSTGMPPIKTVTSSGTFLLEPYETQTNNTKALKILKETLSNGSKNYYYVEFRQPIGFDSVLANFNSSGGNLVNSVLIHQGNSSNGNTSNILDMIPSSTSFYDSGLATGKTFADPNAPNGGVSISVTSVSSAGAQVSVVLGGSTPTCVRANPTLTVSPNTTQWVNQAESKSFTFTLTNNDSAACDKGSFTLTSAPVEGLTTTLSTNSVSVSPGANITFQLQATANTSTGIFAIPVVAANQASSGFTATASANIGIQGVCTRANPTVSLSPTSQTGKAGSILNYTMTVQSNDSADCTPATFTLSGSVPAGWIKSVNKSELILGPSQSGTATLSVTSALSAVAGSYPISGAASNSVTPSLQGSGSAAYEVTAAPAVLAVTITPNQSTYVRNSNAYLKVVVSDSAGPVANARVTVKVVRPDGGAASGSSTTGTSGVITFRYALASTFPVGVYQLSVTATRSTGQTAIGSNSFTVK